MSDLTTIARPYAKAVFEHALAAKQLTLWSSLLQSMAVTVMEPKARDFIDNPSTSVEMKCQLLAAIATKYCKNDELAPVENFITLLALNKRLSLLPDISVQYEILKAQQEKTLQVQVISFSPLTSAQQKTLSDSLSQRLQRKISLAVTIDKSLLGGAVVRAGDLVIDGSVRGKLNKLGTNLAA